MILSMTGYGKSELQKNNKTIKIEARSLNSRFLDLNLRLPSSIKDKEMDVRNVVTEKLNRGKVDLMIMIENGIEEKPVVINKVLAKKYFDELKSLAKEFDSGKKNLLEIVLQMPEVMGAEKNEPDEEKWKEINEVLLLALDELIQFRKREGGELEKIFQENVAAILNLLVKAEAFEAERIENIKTRLRNQLQELLSSEEFDRNRFEQELIYYLEKIDYTEEKMRLRSHCDFFLKTLDDKEANGRRLNFIAQEMGREINTLGSKANHAEIQKLVVQMKDELEKIKEQLLNVL